MKTQTIVTWNKYDNIPLDIFLRNLSEKIVNIIITEQTTLRDGDNYDTVIVSLILICEKVQ